MSLGINNNGTNLQYQQYNQQNQKLTPQQQDNFGALSPETQANLQKVGESAKATAKDSWLGNVLKGFGIEDPKKAAISILGAGRCCIRFERSYEQSCSQRKNI